MATETTTEGVEAVVFDENKHCRRARLYLSCVMIVGLSSVILWGLVTNSDPEAKLLNLNLRSVDANYSSINIQLELINKNYFRGFNYTDIGWIEIYYITGGSTSQMMNYTYTSIDYQGFKKSLRWNFTLDITADDGKVLMKTQDSHVYVSLVLVYWYKILFWTPETHYFQWLEAHAYLNNNSFDLKEPVCFNRTQDFSVAFT